MKVLIIGAHADDPEVSMGGTISKLVEEAHDVKLLVCILPNEARDGTIIDGAKELRCIYQDEASKKLGCDLLVLDMDPYDFRFGRDLVKRIDKEICEFQPNVIFTHWEHDTHQDHKAVAHSTFAAARKNNISVMMYEQLTLGGITPHSFSSQVYIDITDSIDKKIESIKCYEFISDADIDAIYSLARFRGNQIGVKYAECFEICKIISSIEKGGLSITSL